MTTDAPQVTFFARKPFPFLFSLPQGQKVACEPWLKKMSHNIDRADFNRGNILFMKRTAHTEQNYSQVDEIHDSYNKYLMRRPKGGRDSGLDLYVAEEARCESFLSVGCPTTTIKSGVRCELLVDGLSSAFLLYPRSSISKTPLQLANSVGVIDAGYRGEILAKVRNFSPLEWLVETNTRLFQLVAPNMREIFVVLVDELGDSERGEGGFGSTGGTGSTGNPKSPGTGNGALEPTTSLRPTGSLESTGRWDFEPWHKAGLSSPYFARNPHNPSWDYGDDIAELYPSPTTRKDNLGEYGHVPKRLLGPRVAFDQDGGLNPSEY